MYANVINSVETKDKNKGKHIMYTVGDWTFSD